MKIKLDYKGNDREQIEKLINLAYKEVEAFFDKRPEYISIKIHKDRKSFDKELNRKSFAWEIANASYSGEIDIIHPDSLERESDHRKEEFVPILKHEFSHLFLDVLSSNHKIPKWLDEGFASYVAGFKIPKDPIYIEKNFCEKLGMPIGWDQRSNYFAYRISQMFVAFLIKKFSAKKMMALISTLEKNYYYNNFEKKFEKIFDKSILEMENEFVQSIND